MPRVQGHSCPTAKPLVTEKLNEDIVVLVPPILGALMHRRGKSRPLFVPSHANDPVSFRSGNAQGLCLCDMAIRSAVEMIVVVGNPTPLPLITLCPQERLDRILQFVGN